MADHVIHAHEKVRPIWEGEGPGSTTAYQVILNPIKMIKLILLGSRPELLLAIEQVHGCGDDPLFLSQTHILIFKAINFVSAYKSLSRPEILPET